MKRHSSILCVLSAAVLVGVTLFWAAPHAVTAQESGGIAETLPSAEMVLAAFSTDGERVAALEILMEMFEFRERPQLHRQSEPSTFARSTLLARRHRSMRTFTRRRDGCGRARSSSSTSPDGLYPPLRATHRAR